MAQSFLVRHKSAEKFFHPNGGRKDPGNNTCVVLYDGFHAACIWAFDIDEQPWGYIRHVSSGKYIHPHGGEWNPGNNCELVIHEGKHAACLFALDDVNDEIVHKGSRRLAHPRGGSTAPGNNTRVVLHEGSHGGMKFQFMDSNNSSQKILPYGKPRAAGQWKIIRMVINPAATHEDTVTVTIGKLTTESTTNEWTYSWEAFVGVNVDVFEFGAKQSLSVTMSKTSAHTWSKETSRERKITVQPCDTVVTWQFVFCISHGTAKSIFNSNLLADTNDPNVV